MNQRPSASLARLAVVATLAAYPGMMQRARKREGLRVCRAARLIGVSVRVCEKTGIGQAHGLAVTHPSSAALQRAQ